MANANIARGLIPYKYDSGAPYNGAGNVYFVPATNASNLFIGDPVVTVTATSDGNGIPVVAIASAGASNPVLGPIISIVPAGDPQVAVTRDFPVYRQASIGQYVIVADDPTLLFMIQEDSVSGALAAGAVGRNANLVAGTGSTVTGYSGWMLQSSSLATTNTLQLRIRRFLTEADNAVGTNAKWLVKINPAQHELLSSSGI